MLLYSLSILAGLLALTAALAGLKDEMLLRRQRSRDMLHTAFVIYGRRTADGREVQADLYCTDNLIGRRKRKCNICLENLEDPAISRIHARLWLEKGHFCIAPVPRGLLPGRRTYPEIFVNGYAVPSEGMILLAGDLIRMGNSEFYIKDTKE